MSKLSKMTKSSMAGGMFVTEDVFHVADMVEVVKQTRFVVLCDGKGDILTQWDTAPSKEYFEGVIKESPRSVNFNVFETDGTEACAVMGMRMMSPKATVTGVLHGIQMLAQEKNISQFDVVMELMADIMSQSMEGVQDNEDEATGEMEALEQVAESLDEEI